MEASQLPKTFTTVRIQIRTLDGKTTRVEAQPNWTVKDLKEEFGRWMGTGYERVNMHYRAKRLNDSDLLSTYNIAPDGYVQANIRSHGGHFFK